MREYLVEVANETLAFCRRMSANNESILFSDKRAKEIAASLVPKTGCPKIAVTGETTLAALHRLYAEGKRDIGVLNFASGTNAGGGFLTGAFAQDESLCRASSLYPTLITKGRYYDENRQATPFYTENAIYSPDILFFRDDDQNILPKEKMSHAAVLTIPAVNRRNIPNMSDAEFAKIDALMRERMKIILALLAYECEGKKPCKNLILGAFGCGAFKNPPVMVAKHWRDLLASFGGHFESITMAIYDSPFANRAPSLPEFRRILG